MLNKFAIAAVALTVAAPAFAGTVNSGDRMQAALLGLDAGQFTTSQLGQIASEKHADRRAALVKFLTEQSSRGINSAVASDDTLGHSANFGLVTHIGSDN
ncbi:hypothetical protein GL279_01690 [Paracoccus limosus]|uniref:DUF4148 domain-containing protein n=1 Tax=Paracoccus limosus TaxID=913252 RepID=A0A844GZU7_9RHOB|nr:hypothetical protein [Paracoccus limosus]MTH33305.1 hypothetical protein [Paracoccus limosus]